MHIHDVCEYAGRCSHYVNDMLSMHPAVDLVMLHYRSLVVR